MSLHLFRTVLQIEPDGQQVGMDLLRKALANRRIANRTSQRLTIACALPLPFALVGASEIQPGPRLAQIRTHNRAKVFPSLVRLAQIHQPAAIIEALITVIDIAESNPKALDITNGTTIIPPKAANIC